MRVEWGMAAVVLTQGMVLGILVNSLRSHIRGLDSKFSMLNDYQGAMLQVHMLLAMRA